MRVSGHEVKWRHGPRLQRSQLQAMSLPRAAGAKGAPLPWAMKSGPSAHGVGLAAYTSWVWSGCLHLLGLAWLLTLFGLAWLLTPPGLGLAAYTPGLGLAAYTD